jgi:hypothetical protein
VPESFQVISRVNVELNTNVSEISSISFTSNLMMEAEEISEALVLTQLGHMADHLKRFWHI